MWLEIWRVLSHRYIVVLVNNNIQDIRWAGCLLPGQQQMLSAHNSPLCLFTGFQFNSRGIFRAHKDGEYSGPPSRRRWKFKSPNRVAMDGLDVRLTLPWHPVEHETGITRLLARTFAKNG